MTLLEQALEYRKLGLSVIPVLADKKPAILWKEFQERIATEQEIINWFWDEDCGFDPPAGNTVKYTAIGIVTGKISNIIVVDIDTKELLKVPFVYDGMPTPAVETKRGYHIYYNYQDIGNSAGKVQEKVDVRGNGGYVVAPPSPGYSWLNSFNRDEILLLPEYILEKLRGVNSSSRIPDLQSGKEGATPSHSTKAVIQEGGRNNYLTSRAGVLRSKGFEYDTILAAILAENNTNCDPPLTYNEVVVIANSVMRYQPSAPIAQLEEIGSSQSVSGSLIAYNDIKTLEYPPVELIKTNIKPLDDYFAGGMGLKELSLIIAEQETGKTTLSVWIGAAAKSQGYNVLHVFYEDEIRDLRDRYNTCLEGDESESEIYFFDATDKPVTIQEIENKIREKNPGLVIIDYFARMPSLRSENENRFEAKALLMKLKNMAKFYNTHILVLDHITIERFNGSYRMEIHRLSEAKMYKGMIVNLMVGMMKDREDENVLWLTGLKNKRKSRKMFTPISVDWNTGLFSEC